MAKVADCRGPESAIIAPKVPSHMALIRKLFWFSLFLISGFAFTVLFEHGTADYMENARKEFDYLSQMMGAKPERKADESQKHF